MIVDLTVVTLVTRPANLPAIADSIEAALAAATPYEIELRWLVVFDQRKLAGSAGDFATALSFDDGRIGPRDGHVVIPHHEWAGEPFLRNYALDQIKTGHVAWIDDDNAMEVFFLLALGEALVADPTAAVVFDQRRKEGGIRLVAAPDRMHYGAVDTAQVIAPRDLYGDRRFANRHEGCDGQMYEELFAAAPERFRFVNQPRVIYNALA